VTNPHPVLLSGCVAPRWKPRQSGNPGGRTPERAEAERLAGAASPWVIKTLIGALNGPLLANCGCRLRKVSLPTKCKRRDCDFALSACSDGYDTAKLSDDSNRTGNNL
jgi:hypothetical protein